jgi:hypothetical protein
MAAPAVADHEHRLGAPPGAQPSGVYRPRRPRASPLYGLLDRRFRSEGKVGLDMLSIQLLGLKSGQEYEVTLSAATTPFGRARDRLMLYWEHPSDSVRAAYKLGLVGLALGAIALVLAVIPLL